MESIILQIAQEMARKFKEKCEETHLDLCELGPELRELSDETCRNMVEAAIEMMNQKIRDDKESRKGKLVLKEKDRLRTVLTEVGPITVKRDCYQNKETGEYIIPLDKILNIQPYERVTGSVKAKLVEMATEHSYAKSAALVTGGAVSRQTVHNHILQLHVPENQPKQMNQKKKELHVFADEDHVHMQKPEKQKGKQIQMVPVVTVTEGINTEGKRHQTIHPMSFCNEEFETKKLWETVDEYIQKAYDVGELEKIYLHADGGNWIKNGLETYTQTIHVIDGFHFERDLKQISRCFPGRSIRQRIHRAIEKQDKKKADQILQEMLDLAEDEKTVEKVKRFGSYLHNEWDAIYVRRTADIPGSCTEGQVSHLLSERFSRHPMGWSKAGLGKLSVARLYMKNGGGSELRLEHLPPGGANPL